MSGRQREAPEIGAACQRLMRALARRAAGGELEALETLDALTRLSTSYLAQGVAGYREGPAQASWTDVATILGMTRQSAHERWHDARPPA